MTGRAPDQLTWLIGIGPDGMAHMTVHGRTIVTTGSQQVVAARGNGEAEAA